MKKASLLFSLALILIFTSAFSLKEWQTSLYETIKTETIKGIKANFKTDISIGKAEGLVVGQVVFKNVVIPGFAQAKKVYVNYSPVKFAYHKDVVPAISKITIVDGEFKITRDKRNQFNVFSLLPPEDPNAPPPPPFRAKLIFKNCSVDYVDQLGFRSKAKAFNGKASKLKGKISFQREDEISIKLNGEIQNAPAKLSALFDFKRGGYKVNLAAKKVDLIMRSR